MSKRVTRRKFLEQQLEQKLLEQSVLEQKCRNKSVRTKAVRTKSEFLKPFFKSPNSTLFLPFQPKMFGDKDPSGANVTKLFCSVNLQFL
jgi:hypothetical protein